MTSPIDAELAVLAEDFDLIGDWEEQISYVIDLGKELIPLSEDEQVDDNKVRGCVAQVWLITEKNNGLLAFRGTSDAPLVRGLISVLLKLYSGRAPADILAFDAKAAFKRLGLDGLSAQRSNGLASMVERIRQDAAGAL